MDNTRQKNRDAIVFWATGTVYLLFVFFLISGFTRFKIIPSRYANRTVAFTLFPVRWNVYTRTPREPVYKLYTVDKGLAQLYDIRPFAAKFDFGLKRDYKIIAAEMSYIMQDTTNMGTQHSVQISMQPGDDINRHMSVDTLKYNDISSINVRYLQGRYIITKEEPLTREEAMASKKPLKQVLVLPVNIIHRQ